MKEANPHLTKPLGALRRGKTGLPTSPPPKQPLHSAASTPLNASALREARSAPRMLTEIEFKLTAPETQAAPLAAELDRLGPVKTKLLHAHYFDTPDDRLARAGISLRLWQQDGRWVQTLKSSGADDGSSLGALRRDEHEMEVEPRSDRQSPAIDLARHRGSSVGAAAERILTDAGSGDNTEPAQLVKRYGTRIVRRSVQVTKRGSSIELSLDQGQVEAGLHSVPICELELELKSGDVATLARLARRWQRRYGLWLEAERKADRGRRLACGEVAPAVERARPPLLLPSPSKDSFARSTIAGCLAHVLPNASAVAAGSVDADHVHQLRVALRRLRVALRELGELSKDMPTRIERPLARAFAQLGAHRDRESVLEAVKPKLLAAGAESIEWAAANRTPIELETVVSDPAFQRALIDAASFALSPAREMAQKQSALRRRLRRPLRRLHRQVTEDGQKFGKLREEDQHAVRKRLKRLRYLSEFVAPLFKQSQVERYLDGLRPAQDALGEYNDALVAGQMARKAARQPPPGDAGARFAIRWLADERATTARGSCNALRKVGKERRFWR